MKFTKANFDFMSVVGGIAGGMAGKLIEKLTKDESAENNYMTVGLQAVVGAGLSAFVKNSTVKAMGSGMVGVAGYNLAKELNIGEDTETTPSTSGLGMLPSQMAIAGGRRSIPMRSRRYNLRGVEEEKEVKTNVQ